MKYTAYMTDEERELHLKQRIALEKAYIESSRKLDASIRERDAIIKSLNERLEFFKDEERMRKNMLALQKENHRLRMRFREAANDAVHAAKLFINPYTEDLSKVELPGD